MGWLLRRRHELSDEDQASRDVARAWLDQVSSAVDSTAAGDRHDDNTRHDEDTREVPPTSAASG